MDMSRRSFLRGALVVSASAVLPLPALSAPYPILYGDGIHDDTDALNALFRGDTVICENEAITIKKGDAIHLNGGTYRTTATIDVRSMGGVDVGMTNLTILAESVDGPALIVSRGYFAYLNIFGECSGAMVHVVPHRFDDCYTAHYS